MHLNLRNGPGRLATIKCPLAHISGLFENTRLTLKGIRIGSRFAMTDTSKITTPLGLTLSIFIITILMGSIVFSIITTTGTATKKKNATSKAHKTKERRVCVNCKSTETPFWRKGKDGVGSLCNACGLYLAKNDAHRPPLLWKRSSSASEINGSDKTAETTQRIMDEGRDVKDAQPSADDVQTESAPVTTTATVVVNEALNQDISQDERKMMISAVESVKKDAQGGAEK